jgi:glutathione gamma-glutamylcysteinyltransferase
MKSQSLYTCQNQCEREVNQKFLVASKSTFRLCVEASARREGFYVILNNSRKVLGQTGEGHFCPIGGINLRRNLILLFDVARFKYPPQWCPLDLLFASLEPLDKSTEMTRGFALLSRSIEYPSICRMSPDVVACWEFEKWVEEKK